ncbi:MAG: hypothetical protein P4M14_09160 [Gammaproteobacteria bacterium]|nr:hypothetical protein [Gammaproteobacteria bacterium]
MSQQPKLTNYVSPMDQFLQEFDKKCPQQSLSQQKEEAKYRRIYFLRDEENRPEEVKTPWEGL